MLLTFRILQRHINCGQTSLGSPACSLPEQPVCRILLRRLKRALHLIINVDLRYAATIKRRFAKRAQHARRAA